VIIKMDKDLIIYHLALAFNKTHKVSLGDNTGAYMKSLKKVVSGLDEPDRTYIKSYSSKIAEFLMGYLDKICLFDVNGDEAHDIKHDIQLTYLKKHVQYISFNDTIKINGIIPNRLINICGYSGNTNINKHYNEEYNELSVNIYKKISKYDTYADISDKVKNNYIYEPVTTLMYNTLVKKKKVAPTLYNHLFGDAGSDRIVIRLHKSKFMAYDFGNTDEEGKLLNEVSSYRMELYEDNSLEITFDNGAVFTLLLKTNAKNVAEHISLKFNTKFTNMDDIFLIASEKP
jgi:hypothetical protein